MSASFSVSTLLSSVRVCVCIYIANMLFDQLLEYYARETYVIDILIGSSKHLGEILMVDKISEFENIHGLTKFPSFFVLFSLIFSHTADC